MAFVGNIGMWNTLSRPSFISGNSLIAGGSAVGLGTLCLYGLGQASDPQIINEAILWPEHVKQRIQSTFFYCGGSLVLSSMSALACFHYIKNNNLVILGEIAGAIASGIILYRTPYREGLGVKQAVWALNSSIVGALISPVCSLGGPILLRAAVCTAGIVGGLSAVAVCAPHGRFLMFGSPLAIGFGAVFAASIGSILLPPTSSLSSGFYTISLCGGLLVISGYLLENTFQMVHRAEHHPIDSEQLYDPITASMNIFVDVVQIFLRIAFLMADEARDKKNRK